jgi:hypothetical protein
MRRKKKKREEKWKKENSTPLLRNLGSALVCVPLVS